MPETSFKVQSGCLVLCNSQTGSFHLKLNEKMAGNRDDIKII